jgi:hypothetical protein
MSEKNSNKILLCCKKKEAEVWTKTIRGYNYRRE